MNMLAETVRYTPDEFLALNTDLRYELVEGQLVEKTMGARSSRVAVVLSGQLDGFATDRKLGMVFDSDCGYDRCFADDPRRVRKPDVSFVRSGRLPDDVPPEGWIHIPPDLVAEIVSPTNRAPDIMARIADYLRAGVPLIWVLDPRTRLVIVLRQGGSAQWLLGTGELSGENVLPGFTCRIEDLFPGPTTHGATAP